MKKMVPMLVLALAGLSVAAPAVAQPLQCGTVHRVQRGDTLSKIALRVYGRTSAYQRIFDFNPGVMSDPNRLAVDVDLYLPCLNEAADGAADQAEALPELPPAISNQVKILTGSEYPPYVDDGLPNGGFSVELVERALLANGGKTDYRVDVIHDWSSHLVPLLEEGAYDLAFPWFKPDCAKRGDLGEGSIWRCDNLRFSAALHDVVVSFYARSDQAASLTSAEDLKGLRICRPRGYFTHDLEAMGLVPDTYERRAPGSPEDCFEELMDGEADVVTVNADTSDKIVTALDIRDQVAELVDLANVQTLHVVALKRDPRARVNVLRVDQGLRQLQLSGEYRKIAATHLSGE